MAAGVVDALEAIEVTDDQADDRAVRAVRLDGLVQLHIDGTPVGETGEGVGVRQPSRLLQPLRLGDPGGDDGSKDGGEVGVGPPEDGRTGGTRHIELAPRPSVQHDRGDDAAAAAAAAQGGDPLMDVTGAAARRGPLRRLHPRVGLTAPGPPLVQELGDLGELVHRVRLVLRELVLPLAPLPHVHEDPQPTALPLPHRQRGEAPAERPARPGRRRAPRLVRAVGRRHALRQRDNGSEPLVITHHSRLGRFRAIRSIDTAVG